MGIFNFVINIKKIAIKYFWEETTMPIPFDQIYRDAADSRISWEEALVGTLVIDDNGDLVAPANDKEKVILHRKAQALHHYSRSVEDNLLKDVIKKLKISL